MNGQTNYHEAGHAVVAHKMGRTVNYVSINPNSSLGEPGAVSLDPASKELMDTESFRNDYEAIKKEIIICLAGHSAENAGDPYAFDPHSLSSAFKDIEMARQLASLIDGDTDELLQRMYSETCELVTDLWSAIKTLAEALLEQGELNGNEVRKILESV